MAQQRRRPLADLLGDDEPSPPKRSGRKVEDHRQQLVLAQARLAEVRTAKLRGELVPAADVEAEWSTALADLRAALLALPNRIGAACALPPETIAAVDREIRAALAALAASGGVSAGGDV